jgi:hypothetical protein
VVILNNKDFQNGFIVAKTSGGATVIDSKQEKQKKEIFIVEEGTIEVVPDDGKFLSELEVKTKISETFKEQNKDIVYTVKFIVDGKPYEILGVKNKQHINSPATAPEDKKNLSFINWIDEEGDEVSFPYFVEKDTILQARFKKSYAKMLYNHYQISKEDYPYIFITTPQVSNQDGGQLYFVNSYSIKNNMMTTGKRKHAALTYYKEERNMKSIVNYILANTPTLDEEYGQYEDPIYLGSRRIFTTVKKNKEEIDEGLLKRWTEFV